MKRLLIGGTTALTIVAIAVILLLTFSIGDHTLWHWLCTPWWYWISQTD